MKNYGFFGAQLVIFNLCAILEYLKYYLHHTDICYFSNYQEFIYTILNFILSSVSLNYQLSNFHFNNLSILRLQAS